MTTLIQASAHDWTDYVSAAGNFATAVTFIYVIIKEFRTRRQITDLAVIVKELNQQNVLLRQQVATQVRPIIKATHDNVTNSSLDITLLNEGGTCFKISIVPNKNLKIISDDYSNILQPKEWLSVSFVITHQNFVNGYDGYEVEVFVFFEDMVGNRFKATVIRKSGPLESAFIKSIEEIHIM